MLGKIDPHLIKYLNKFKRLIMDDIERLKIKDKEIILVGTAHISRESVDLVRETILEEKPDIVGVELCEQRYETLTSEEQKWEDIHITDIIKEGKTHLFLITLLLSAFQRKIGDKIGIKPGSEMIEAINTAKENNIGVELLDRDIQITLKRAIDRMSLREKLKLLFELIYGFFGGEEIDEELIEKLKEKDIMTELMDELSREIPSIKEVLIDERNVYIADKILLCKGEKIVVVIGAGHVEGIKTIIQTASEAEVKNVEKINIADLEKTPKGGNKLKYIGYLVPLVIVGIVAFGFHLKGGEFVLDSAIKWFLINGILSAIGVMLALGHPLTILGAFLAAPFTSLNPMIAAGWVAGMIEIWVRKPRVKDFEGLAKLNDVRSLWQNRITKILLVVVFANVGSSIGTFVAGLSIFKDLFGG